MNLFLFCTDAATSPTATKMAVKRSMPLTEAKTGVLNMVGSMATTKKFKPDDQ